MEYIKEISINEAVLHVLDVNIDKPILNDYKLELNEETYKFLIRHIERSLKDEELRYALFDEYKNITKDASQDYLKGQCDLLDVSKEIASQLFMIMKSKGNISSSDLIAVSISTEFGPMLGIIKLNYIKNYIHNINYIENKVGIDIRPLLTALPLGKKIEQCAFIKPIKFGQEFNIMVLDKLGNKSKDEYGSNYFTRNFLGCNIIKNERDNTKEFLQATEIWTRHSLKEDADTAEIVRSHTKKKLMEEESIDVTEFAEELFKNQPLARESFIQHVKALGVDDNIKIDKAWINKKARKKRLKIDKDIDLYIDEEAYTDENRFIIKRNGDGTIDMVIKNVLNYIEK